MKKESQRTCPSCGNEFSGAMEFCPVCMLRKGLGGGAESGESSSGDTLKPTTEQALQRFEHWSKIVSRSRSVADKLAGGVEFLFKKNQVAYLRGEASLTAAGKVTYKSRDGKEEIVEAGHILIATGAASRGMPGLPANGKSVINSHDAMILDPQPKKLLVIGAGAIGVEFAYFFNAFSTKVTLIEMLPNVLPLERHRD